MQHFLCCPPDLCGTTNAVQVAPAAEHTAPADVMPSPALQGDGSSCGTGGVLQLAAVDAGAGAAAAGLLLPAPSVVHHELRQLW